MVRWLRIVVVFYTLSLTGCTAGNVLSSFFGAENSDDAYGKTRGSTTPYHLQNPAEPTR